MDHLVGKDLEPGGQGSRPRFLPYHVYDTKQTHNFFEPVLPCLENEWYITNLAELLLRFSQL